MTLRKDHENCVDECEAAHQKIKFLENLSTEKTENIDDLKKEISLKNGLVSTLNIEIHQLNQENEGIRSTVEDLTQEIKDLESLNKKGRLEIN